MSTNITKQKRDELVSKINQIREFLTQSSDENATQLLGFLGELENDVTNKKYGLVFEEHRESIDEKLESSLPVLMEEKSLEIDNGGLQNFLIEGDNLASLKLLEKTHRGKIDVIYIDPPYNRGSNDFIYDDDYVDENDTFKHSKWCSFMEKRLRIAKRLLSEQGLIFISIDDNEQATLKFLCDNVFNNENFIAQIIIASNSTKNNSKTISVTHEYILCYSKNKNFLPLDWEVNKNNYSEFNKRVNQLLDRNLSPQEIHTELLELVKYPRFYDFDHFTFADEKGVYETDNPGGVKNGNTQTQILHPTTKKPCKIPDGGWRYKENEIRRLENEGLFEFGIDESVVPRPKKYLKDFLTQVPKSIIFFDSQSTTKWLKAEKFDFGFPKAIELIQYIISMYPPNKSSTILDFFAGSGTTGHAVMKLNATDNGKRKFILCTNNQNNICRDITYERLKRVIEKENYSASLKYFRVDFVDITDKLYYEYADKLLKHTRELVELENAINFNKNSKIAICLTEEELDSFCNSKKKISTVEKIYLGHEVQTTAEQEELFNSKQIEIVRIPNYYYSDVE